MYSFSAERKIDKNHYNILMNEENLKICNVIKGANSNVSSDALMMIKSSYENKYVSEVSGRNMIFESGSEILIYAIVDRSCENKRIGYNNILKSFIFVKRNNLMGMVEKIKEKFECEVRIFCLSENIIPFDAGFSQENQIQIHFKNREISGEKIGKILYFIIKYILGENKKFFGIDNKKKGGMLGIDTFCPKLDLSLGTSCEI